MGELSRQVCLRNLSNSDCAGFAGQVDNFASEFKLREKLRFEVYVVGVHRKPRILFTESEKCGLGGCHGHFDVNNVLPKKGGEVVCGLAGQVGTLTARAPSSIDNWGPGLRQVSFHRKPSALIRKAGHVIWVLPLILTLDPKTYPFRGDEVCIARCLGCCPGKFGPGISFSRKFDRGLLGKLAN